MLEISNHGRVREIRLARPPVNALNTEFVSLLTQSLHEASEDSGAVILSGRDGMFCAGIDVVELMQLDREKVTDFWSAFFSLLETVACSPIPIACAITGHSPAGGAVISMFSDYRVMSRGNYMIGLNETRVGLIVPRVLQNAMARLVGAGNAEQMLVSGAMINPEEALKSGFVDALEDDFDATTQNAHQWCDQLLALPPQAMLGNRAIARSHFKQEFANDTANGVATFVDTWFSDETQGVIKTLVTQLKSKK
jgi:enoyl-CoA hydratase/carnithine racemase